MNLSLQEAADAYQTPVGAFEDAAKRGEITPTCKRGNVRLFDSEALRAWAAWRHRMIQERGSMWRMDIPCVTGCGRSVRRPNARCVECGRAVRNERCAARQMAQRRQVAVLPKPPKPPKPVVDAIAPRRPGRPAPALPPADSVFLRREAAIAEGMRRYHAGEFDARGFWLVGEGTRFQPVRVGTAGVKPASIHFYRAGRWDERPVGEDGQIRQSMYISNVRPSLAERVMAL